MRSSNSDFFSYFYNSTFVVIIQWLPWISYPLAKKKFCFSPFHGRDMMNSLEILLLPNFPHIFPKTFLKLINAMPIWMNCGVEWSQWKTLDALFPNTNVRKWTLLQNILFPLNNYGHVCSQHKQEVDFYPFFSLFQSCPSNVMFMPVYDFCS